MEEPVSVGGNVSCNTDEYVCCRSIIIVMIMLIIIVYLTDPLDSSSVINYVTMYIALPHEYARSKSGLTCCDSIVFHTRISQAELCCIDFTAFCFNTSLWIGPKVGRAERNEPSSLMRGNSNGNVCWTGYAVPWYQILVSWSDWLDRRLLTALQRILSHWTFE